MVEFETITAEEVEFGRNNFIEVARKKAIGDDGEREFISLSRGYHLPDGTKKWKASITLPDEEEKREKIAELIKKL
jgi:acetone carboxylase gamma subunit